MKNKLILIMAVIAASLVFTACNDDGYSLDYEWRSPAIIENPSHSSVFFFTLDNGERMWTAASQIPGYRPEDGARVIAYYTILSDTPAGSDYDHDVRLNRVYQILTKEIVDLTPENEMEIGNDPIRVIDIWGAHDYVNVEFEFMGYNRSHFINMVYDASDEYDDGKLHLKFRHNARGDYASRWMWGVASFDLLPFREGTQESVELVIHYSPYNSTRERTYEFEYRFGSPDTAGRRFDQKEAGEID